MNNWIYIAVMFAVSYAIRILPLTLIRKPIENQFIQSFLYYVPYVTLAVMTFPAKLCMRKILVTGSGGFVGARILDQWRGRYELCTFPHGFSADSDEAAVRALIAREKPDVIVHTAALSNTAYCASHPEESIRANVLLPEWIAKAAAETGAKLLALIGLEILENPATLDEINAAR